MGRVNRRTHCTIRILSVQPFSSAQQPFRGLATTALALAGNCQWQKRSLQACHLFVLVLGCKHKPCTNVHTNAVSRALTPALSRHPRHVLLSGWLPRPLRPFLGEDSLDVVRSVAPVTALISTGGWWCDDEADGGRPHSQPTRTIGGGACQAAV